MAQWAALALALISAVLKFFGVRVDARKDYLEAVDDLPAPQDANAAKKAADEAAEKAWKDANDPANTKS